MFENENLKPSGATSSDVPTGGGSTAGAAPDPFRVAMPVMLIESAADCLAKLDPWIREHQLAELRSFGDARAQTLGATGLSTDFIAGYELALQVARLYVATTPNLATIHIAPAPGSDDFAAAMERSRADQSEYFSNLLETIGPKLVAFAKQVRAESAAPLDKDTHDQIVADCEALAQATATRIAEQSKQDVILGVQMLLKPILDQLREKPAGFTDPLVAPLVASPAPGSADPAARPIVVGDKVKVWVDAEKKRFLAGTVQAVHDAGHSFDVELDNRSVAHVQAGNLALDELAK